jgi:hypothetical protein
VGLLFLFLLPKQVNQLFFQSLLKKKKKKKVHCSFVLAENWRLTRRTGIQRLKKKKCSVYVSQFGKE